MQQYLDFMQYVLDEGTVRQDRTKTGTISVFGEQLKFDLDPFPIITTKKNKLACGSFRINVDA